MSFLTCCEKKPFKCACAMVHTVQFLRHDVYHPFTLSGGGGYCHIWAIYVCAAVKDIVFKQFTLG